MTHPVDDPNERTWQRLSALCDGEADAAEAQDSFERWRDEPALRERWHTYQWIGDVMRSEDLASDAGHDQDFLIALRARLATEPVVLAPAPAVVPAAAAAPAPVAALAAGGRRLRWGTPVAMAAGVVVTGALVMMNYGGSRASGDSMAPTLVVDTTSAPPQALAAVAASAPVPPGDLVRDPELDRYLNAHRQLAGNAYLAVPGGVRQVAVTTGGH
jgi:sigma-E factor negative regulatory protein RseA